MPENEERSVGSRTWEVEIKCGKGRISKSFTGHRDRGQGLVGRKHGKRTWVRISKEELYRNDEESLPKVS